MEYALFFSPNAEADLDHISSWTKARFGGAKAQALLDELQAATFGLLIDPMRGAVPKELDDQTRISIRQIFVSGIRICYRIDPNRVSVFLIADGRRDFATLLQSRLDPRR